MTKEIPAISCIVPIPRRTMPMMELPMGKYLMLSQENSLVSPKAQIRLSRICLLLARYNKLPALIYMTINASHQLMLEM